MTATKVELAERFTDGLLVRLLWNEMDGSVSVSVETPEGAVEAAVPSEVALDAFYHPGAYVEGMCEIV